MVKPLSKKSLTAALGRLPERDLVALVAFRGLTQAGDPDAGYKAYQLADDFLKARESGQQPPADHSFPFPENT